MCRVQGLSSRRAVFLLKEMSVCRMAFAIGLADHMYLEELVLVGFSPLLSSEAFAD
jgi:hypothetical protein